MHPGLSSWDGDRSIPGWRSMHPGMAIDAPGVTIAAPLDGDRFISGWRSMHHGMVIDASGGGDRYTRSGVAASLVGDR